MKLLYIIAFACCFVHKSYTQLLPNAHTGITLDADQFIGIDTFDALYYTKDQILYKKWNSQSWQYGDYSLGNITSVHILNPLKIIVFYANTNTVLFLDKYLTEIDRIAFNTLSEFKNVSFVSPANDTNFWIFDSNTQQLELFDSVARSTIVTTQPLPTIPISQNSNFYYCWLANDTQLLQFNTYGTLTNTFAIEHIKDIRVSTNHLVFQKENGLYRLSYTTNTIEKIKLPEITTKQFYVTNEILYIYDRSTIHSFDLTPPKK